MNNKRLILIFITLLTASCSMSQRPSVLNCWTGGTALTLTDNRYEIRLFGYSGYGLTDRLEISAHPLMFWLMPQVKVKYRWSGLEGIILSSEHQLSYPTLFLNVISRKGIGGMISPEFNFPQIFSLYNGIIATRKVSSNSMLTGKAGIIIAVRTGAIDERSTIDLPVIYPRFASFYHMPVINPGVDYRGKLFSSIGGQIAAECFIIPTDNENFFFENKGLLTWTLKTNWQFLAGYRLSYGTYPFGNQWHLLPAIEVIAGF